MRKKFFSVDTLMGSQEAKSDEVCLFLFYHKKVHCVFPCFFTVGHHFFHFSSKVLVPFISSKISFRDTKCLLFSFFRSTLVGRTSLIIFNLFFLMPQIRVFSPILYSVFFKENIAIRKNRQTSSLFASWEPMSVSTEKIFFLNLSSDHF